MCEVLTDGSFGYPLPLYVTADKDRSKLRYEFNCIINAEYWLFVPNVTLVGVETVLEAFWTFHFFDTFWTPFEFYAFADPPK